MGRVLSVAAPAVVALAVASSGSATTQPSVVLGVSVSLTRTAVTLSSKQAQRGQYVEFHVKNTSPVRRTFSVAGKTIAVPAHSNRQLLVFFDARGRYRYVSRGTGTSLGGTFRIF